MKQWINRLATTALAALAGISAARAHHSISVFDIHSPIWVKGTVVGFALVNPHPMITLEETLADGQMRRWTIDGPNLRQAERRGIGPDFFEAGDVIEFCAFPVRVERSSGQATGTDGTPPRLVHGLVMIDANGEMKMWGGYGKLDNCIAPEDPIRTWVDFINSDEMARASWCARHRLATPSTTIPQATVDEITRRMTQPC